MQSRIKRINNLWKYRKRAGLSQKRAAFLMGLRSASSISSWEHGSKLPSLANAFKLAYVLGTFVLDLFPDLTAHAQYEVIKRREQGSGTVPVRVGSSRILALKPGTKEIGVALLEDGEKLDYYAVKSLTRQNSPSEVIEKLVQEKQPSLVVIERGSKRCSKRFFEVAEKITHTVKGVGLKVKSLTRSDVTRLVLGNEQVTKVNVAKALCHHFPDLAPYRKPPHIFQEKYWFKMFDAVAASLAGSIRH